MRVLGIDPGKKCTGIVLIEDGRVTYADMCMFEAPTSGYPLWIDGFTECCMELAQPDFKPDLIIREAVYVGLNKQTAIKNAHITGIIDAICWEYLSQVPCEVGNKQWQKVVFGKAKPTRDKAKAQARKLARVPLGIKRMADVPQDLADAWCIATYGVKMRETLDVIRRT